MRTTRATIRNGLASRFDLDLGQTMDRTGPRDTIQRVGIGRKGVCSTLAHDKPRLGVEVLNNIASLMVALVVCNPSLTSPPSKSRQKGNRILNSYNSPFDLLSSLDTTSTSLKTTSREASIEERLVITSARERSSGTVNLGRSVVVGLEGAFDMCASRGASKAMGITISVQNKVPRIWRGSHVKVEVEGDAGLFLLRKMCDVVLGSDETLFFCRPPGESDGILEGVSGKVEGEFEDGDGARAIIVEPLKDRQDYQTGFRECTDWSCGDGVTVCSEEHKVILLSALSGSDEIAAVSLFVGERNVQRSNDL